MRAVLFFVAILMSVNLSAQFLTGINTKLSDTFSEWVIFFETEGTEEEGELRMRWASRNDWTEWNYRIGEQIGTIKLKWGNDPNEWELRGDNEIVTARTLWKNNFQEWRINSNNTQLVLKSRYGNVIDEWEIRQSDHGYFKVFTSWEGDPREWVIVDELVEDITLPMRILMTFIVVFQSSPKS